MVEPGPSGFAETDSLMSPREPPAPNPSPLSAGVVDVAFCFNTGDLNSDPDASWQSLYQLSYFPNPLVSISCTERQGSLLSCQHHPLATAFHLLDSLSRQSRETPNFSSYFDFINNSIMIFF